MPYGTRPRNGHGRPRRRHRYEPIFAAPCRYDPYHCFPAGPSGRTANFRLAAAAIPFVVAWAAAPALAWMLAGFVLLRIVLDPWVAAARAARRCGLASAERARKAMRVVHRTSRREPPSRELLLRCWELSRDSLEGKILLGSLLGDADAVADHSYIRGENGEIVGRRGGVRRWLDEVCPELAPHYKTLMRYKAMADKFRRVCGLGDPDGAEDALAPGEPVVSAISDLRSQISFDPAAPARFAAARRKARELLAEHRTMKALDEALWAALGLVRTRRRPAAA